MEYLHRGIPCEENSFLSGHIHLLRSSYKLMTGQDLVETTLTKEEGAKDIFYSTNIVLSHNTFRDPLLNYINQVGLTLFEMDWEKMLQTPSRLTAESIEQEARKILLDKVSDYGFIDDYSGVRISSTGRRFKIEKATVWNLVDLSDNCYGQAAMFSNWRYLD